MTEEIKKETMYNEYGSHNGYGKRLSKDVENFIKDTLENYYDCECRDIFEIINDTVQAMKCEKRLVDAVKLRKERRNNV